MIFIVKDEHDELRDRVSWILSISEPLIQPCRRMWRSLDNCATHHVSAYEPSNGSSGTGRDWPWQDEAFHLVYQIVSGQRAGGDDLEILTRLWNGHRRCAPRLSTEAAEKLSSHFVSLRKQVQQVERDNNERSSIPITIRSVSHTPCTLLGLWLWLWWSMSIWEDWISSRFF